MTFGHSHWLWYFTLPAKASSVPGSMHTAISGALSEANPRVVVLGNVVVIASLLPGRGSFLQRVNYSHTWDCSSVWPRPRRGAGPLLD